MRFDLTRWKLKDAEGKPLDSFDMVELTGQDSTDAMARVAPASPRPGDPPPNGYAIATAHKNELIGASITHVNGEPVMTPYSRWQAWPLRTQEFVVAAFQSLNEATQSELADFRKAAFGSSGTP